MLRDLGLTEKYSSSFADGGVDDAYAKDVNDMLAGDDEEKLEGVKGVEEIIGEHCHLCEMK